MVSYALNLTIKEAEEMPLPAILFWNQNHFVVLYKVNIKKGLFYIVDPAQGKIRFTLDELKRHWQGDSDRGIAILIAPDTPFDKQTFEPETRNIGVLQMMKTTVAKHRRSFVAITIFTIIALCAEIVLPLLFQQTVDEGINNKDIPLVWLLVFSQLFVFLGNYISNIIVEVIITKLGLRMSIEMMNNYLKKLITLPLSFFDKKLSSDLIQKAEDQNRLKDFLLSTPTSAFFTILTLLVFSGLLIYYNFGIFLLFLVLTVMMMGWTLLFMHKRKHIDYTYFSYASENRNNFYELVYGMPEIKTNNAQNIRVGVWNKVQEKINALTIKSTYLRITMNSGVSFLTRLRDIIITGLSATLVIKGSITFGMMITISYVVGRLSSPFSTLISSFTAIQDASMSYERLKEILFNNTPVGSDESLPEDADIVLKNVSFKYAGSLSPFVIDNVDLVIPNGKTTALVGASGCGKTTLIKLLIGFYDPQIGEIQVGNRSLKNLNKDKWLSGCGVVMQSGYIFSGSVAANIALCDEKPDMERVEYAASMAALSDFIKTMPMGYSTRIGVNGIDLSGGQKQRLLIARAIYKNPKLLILDEATSSLDANNERIITENIDRIRNNKTVIIAAHRLSTVKNADKIVYMEKGKIVEQGTHEELIALKGSYYTLVKNQLELDA
jgi:ATP-binding cassette subfamily B protein